MTQPETLRPRDTVSSSSKPTASFDLRFFLTEPEWREAILLLHPFVGRQYIKSLLRVVNGCGAIIIMMVPHRFGWSWPLLFQLRPAQAVFLAALVFVSVWSATGVGMKRLDHRLNRLDLARHIVVSDQGVNVDWNAQTWNYQWKDFVYFRETEELVVMRTAGTKFWTIPIRVFQPEDAARFRELLRQNLPHRQPWSWSAGSSAAASR
jgi:YcxB-like protein